MADGILVGGAVNVDVALMGIHVSALIPAGFESFQPQNAGRDFCVCEAGLGSMAHVLARPKYGSGGKAGANFFANSMQSERRAV